jgi:hypothetical protein
MKESTSLNINKVINEMFAKHFPEFEPVNVESPLLLRGDSVFCWKAVPSIFCFIIYVPHQKDKSRFTFEVGWSKKNRFPELNMRPCIDDPDQKHSEFINEEYLCRIGALMNRDDCWWKYDASNINKIVEDSLGSIREFALPYLREFVSQ